VYLALATYYILHPEASIEDCRRWASLRVEALNHALRGLPEEKIRYHTCQRKALAGRRSGCFSSVDDGESVVNSLVGKSKTEGSKFQP